MEQKTLTYYLVSSPNIADKSVYLYAYGDYYDFFKTYDIKEKKWLTSKISFSRMLHDFCYREISEEEAKKMTDGNLPTDLYKSFCDMISSVR